MKNEKETVDELSDEIGSSSDGETSLSVDDSEQGLDASLNVPNAGPVPRSIELPGQVFEICFHPSQPIIVSGLITGSVHCHSFSVEENSLKFSFDLHTKSIRDLRFLNNSTIVSVSADKSIRTFDVDTREEKMKIPKAHEEGINVLSNIDENSLITGDDDGVIKIWDLRSKNAEMEYRENTDFIADLKFCGQKKTLLAASGDGALSVFDIRKPKLFARSEYYEDDLLSLAIMKGGKKVVAGSQMGILNIFTWGMWGDVADRYPGHPLSIDTLCPYNDDILFTGSSDGLIRAVQIGPNGFLGLVGAHDYPVESIKLSSDRTLVASCSHDQKIAFWNVSDFQETHADIQDKMAVPEAERGRVPQSAKSKVDRDFFQGLE